MQSSLQKKRCSGRRSFWHTGNSSGTGLYRMIAFKTIPCSPKNKNAALAVVPPGKTQETPSSSGATNVPRTSHRTILCWTRRCLCVLPGMCPFLPGRTRKLPPHCPFCIHTQLPRPPPPNLWLPFRCGARFPHAVGSPPRGNFRRRLGSHRSGRQSSAGYARFRWW